MADPDKKKKQPPSGGAEYEAFYSGGPSGEVAGGEAGYGIGPVVPRLRLGVITLSERKPAGFFTPRLSMSADFGRTHLYGEAAFTHLFETHDLPSHRFFSFSTGITYDFLRPRPGKTGVRGAFEIQDYRESAGSKTTYGGYGHMTPAITGAGISFIQDPLTFYAIGRFSLNPKDAYAGHRNPYLVSRPYPLEFKAGAVYRSRRASVSLEASGSAFTTGAGIRYSSSVFPFGAQLGFDYTRMRGPFDSWLGVASLEVPLEKKPSGRIRRVYSERGFGPRRQHAIGSRSLDPTTVGALSYTMPDALQAQGYSANPGEAKSKMKSWDKITPLFNTRKPFESAWLATGGQTSFAAEFASQSGIKPQQFVDFQDGFAASANGFEFGSRYRNASLESKLDAALMLSALMGQFPSAPSSEVAKGNPQRDYSALKRTFASGDFSSAGVCVNRSGIVAEFLRGAGVKAYTIAINVPQAGHMVTVVYDKATGTGHMIDTDGKRYFSKGPGVSNIIQNYLYSRFGTFSTVVGVYGPGNCFIGNFKTDEGLLIDRAMGLAVGSRVKGKEDTMTRALIR